MMRRIALTLLLAGSLAGCSSAADRALRASPDFQAGYRDGCSAASIRGANPRDDSMMRDEAGYQGNKAYHSGWNTGFSGCRLYQPGNTPGSADRGPIPNPIP